MFQKLLSTENVVPRGWLQGNANQKHMRDHITCGMKILEKISKTISIGVDGKKREVS